jgi:transcriptional regulator with XRE-family HTH domain
LLQQPAEYLLSLSACGKIAAMPDLCLNIRYLLWKMSIPRSEWGKKLSDLLGWSEGRAEELFEGNEIPRNSELKTLAKFGGVSEKDLTSKDFLQADRVDIFHENLSFLIDLLPHGEKKHFADKLGVDATTISRWKNGSQHPTKRKISAIIRYFSLSEDTDLMAVPVFLSLGPIGEAEVRKWLHQQIDQLDSSTLQDLLPALNRIFHPK